MKHDIIKFPKVQTRRIPGSKEVKKERIINYMTSGLNKMPKYISALKESDNEGWQNIVDEMTIHVLNDKKLSTYIRPNERNGNIGVSIGAPNIFVEAAAAFAIGYAIGTLLYKSGIADFSTGVWDSDPDEDDECEKDPNCFH